MSVDWEPPADWWDQLVAVNHAVNSDTRHVDDAELYGRPDFWTAADGEGDCEDFALAKRKRLLAQGWPASTLRLATCWTTDGQYHAVLVVVHPMAGAYVLDNLFDQPMAWQAAGHRWHKIQIPGQQAWRRIESG